MSDLGPFVAAHLRDKVVADLLEENQQLKTQLQSARRIAITGPGGSPIYAQKDFSQGRYDPTELSSGEWWEVSFDKTYNEKEGEEKPSVCKLSNLPSCEVRIGSFVKIKVGEFDHLCVCHYSRESSTVKVKYCNIDPSLEVGVHIPMCEELFLSIHSRTQRLDSGSSLFMDLIPTDLDPTVIVEDLTFHADAARQALLDFGIHDVEWLDRDDVNEGSSQESLGKGYGTRTPKSTGTS